MIFGTFQASEAETKEGKGKAGPKAVPKNGKGASKARRSIDYRNRSDLTYDPSEKVSQSVLMRWLEADFSYMHLI